VPVRRLLVALFVLVAATVVVRGQIPCDVVGAQPSCYVTVQPGPTRDTLGIVEITDADTFPSQGRLLLTTVAVDTELGPLEFVADLFDDQVDTVRRDVLYPTGESDDDVAERNTILMTNSQLTATIAGLRAAGYELDESAGGAEVVAIVDDAAVVDDDVAVGDVVVAVDGTAVTTSDDAVEAVQRVEPGDDVELRFERDGEPRTVTVTAGANPDDPSSPFLGVLLADHFDLPVTVDIDAGNIGGPSAGLLFALSIVDLLGEDDLTAGEVVAGTGTIDRDGNVGAIGGIRQKIVGATDRDEPATVFLVPAGNFDEAVTAPVAREILLVPVATLDEAHDALTTLSEGGTPVSARTLSGADSSATGRPTLPPAPNPQKLR
jgi:PDZ domain-containing protein